MTRLTELVAIGVSAKRAISDTSAAKLVVLAISIALVGSGACAALGTLRVAPFARHVACIVQQCVLVARVQTLVFEAKRSATQAIFVSRSPASFTAAAMIANFLHHC